MSRDIAVDKSSLAKCFGLSEWPVDVPLNQEFQQMAARVITDAFQALTTEHSFNSKAYCAIYNAESWIKDAYKMGLEAGRRSEREAWEWKITRLFGLSEKK